MQLPQQLDNRRRNLLLGLELLWERVSDFRFGQMLRVAVDAAVPNLRQLTDEAIAHGVPNALERVPDNPPAPGPYWDTETRDGRNFISGLPRDPARIQPLIEALGRAWAAHPSASLAALLEAALDRAGVPENEFETRWLLIEDAAMTRALGALASEPPPKDANW